jgi:hypothetical protein
MLVLVVGRQQRDDLAAIRGVVHDWSAVGLVSRSVWVDVDPANTRYATLIESGIATPVDLYDWLPRNYDTDIRLLVAQVLTDRAGAISVSEAGTVGITLNLKPGTPQLNLLIPASEVRELPTDIVFDGQFNVVAQPVDGTDPRSATQAMTADTRTFSMHGAAAISTAAGLWVGMQGGPLDGERSTGDTLVVSRTYLRRLDASPVLDRLAADIFGPELRLPMTVTDYGQALGVVAAGEQLAAADDAMGAVLARHAEHTRFRMGTFAPPTPKPLRLAKAFAMFFPFLWRAMKNAGPAWAREQINRAKASLEASATNFFFGNQSQYAVVLSGMRPTTGDVDQALTFQQVSMQFLRHRQPAPPSLPVLWQDTVRAVTGLADGGGDPMLYRLPLRGSARLVIDNPAVLAAPPEAPAFVLPTGAPGSEFGPVAPNDPFHARMLDRHLAGIEAGAQQSPTPEARNLAEAANGLRARLGRWVAERQCAAWTLSDGLAIELDKARAAQVEMGREVPGLTEEDMHAPLAAQRRARRNVFIWLFVLLLAVGLVVGLAAAEVIGWLVAAGLGLLALAMCLFGAVLSFQRGQRALFKAIHKLEIGAAYRQWLQGQSVSVAEQVVTLAALYRQSRVWADVLTEYVHAPFGRADSNQAIAAERLSGELPLAMTLASAQFVPDLHEPLLYRVRSETLRPDWLANQVADRRAMACRRVNRLTGNDVADRIDSDAELLVGGPLLSYLDALRQPALRQEVRSAAMEKLAQKVRQVEERHDMLPSVRIDAGAIRTEQSWQDLTRELLRRTDELPHDGYSDSGVMNRASAVSRSYLGAHPTPWHENLALLRLAPSSGRHLLDRTVIRWDLSRSTSVSDLTYFDVDERAIHWDPEPPPIAVPS